MTFPWSKYGMVPDDLEASAGIDDRSFMYQLGYSATVLVPLGGLAKVSKLGLGRGALRDVTASTRLTRAGYKAALVAALRERRLALRAVLARSSIGTNVPRTSLWSDAVRRQEWVDDWVRNPENLKPERGAGPAYDYQRLHAGPDQVRLASLDGTRVWADGLHVDPDKVVAVDTKYVVEAGSKSLYEGGKPDFLYRQFDNEMQRYGAVVSDPSNPVDRLRIITNTDAAAEFLERRARSLLGNDIDIVTIVRP